MNIDDDNPAIYLLNSIYIVWECKENNKKNKLMFFKDYILKNHNYDILINFIDKSIRYTYLLKKYSKKWVTYYINKKDPINIRDLEFNPINNDNYYINYIDYVERKRYLFSENDFRKIVISCLHNSYEYDIDPDPINIKNPYNNHKLTKTELRMFNNSIRDMPISWIMFVDSDFDIFKLKSKYYINLLELCIPNYVDKLNDLDIIDYILDIFTYLNESYCNKCLISKRDIHSKSIKNALIEWIRYLKLDINMSNKVIENIKNKYKVDCIYCFPQSNNLKNIENKFILQVDITKPLFFMGEIEDNEDIIYTSKIDIKKDKRKKRKERQKMMKRIKALKNK